jgi:hypothetical protein
VTLVTLLPSDGETPYSTREWDGSLVIQKIVAVVVPGKTETDEITGRVVSTVSTTVAVSNLVLFATLVARTVTIWRDVTDDGALYSPVDEMVPRDGLIDQVTDLFVAPSTTAVNRRIWPAVRFALDGLTTTLIPDCVNTLTDVVFVKPKAVAVIRTDVAAVAEFSRSVNGRLVDPAGIVRLDGIVTLAPEVEKPSETVYPVDGAAAVKDTAHCDEPGACITAGLQLIDDKATERMILIEDPDPIPLTRPAVGEAPTMLSSWIELDVAVELEEILNVAVAIVPVAITVLFTPKTIHLWRPAAIVLHLMLFPLALATEPMATETLLKSAGEYANVHITLLVCMLFAVNVTGIDIKVPGCPESDPSDKLIDCPKAIWLHRSSTGKHKNLLSFCRKARNIVRYVIPGDASNSPVLCAWARSISLQIMAVLVPDACMANTKCMRVRRITSVPACPTMELYRY